MMQNDCYLPAGSTARGGYTTVITPERAGWTYSGLRILELAAGASAEVSTGPEEMLVLPLAGGAAVACDGATYRLAGRRGVFSGPSDFAYVPRDSAAIVTAADGPARIALPTARCERRLKFRYGPVDGVSVEIRGAGQATRQVNNFCAPDAFETDAICAVEVLTPGGNWSSYPPHKHDEARDGEAVLEEIYYFEVAGEHGLGYQRVYGTLAGKRIDVLEQVRSGDVVLVPFGYHGPSMAAPGYDLYYLNVLAGPGAERSMSFCDDPDHHWVRDSWDGVPTDPRVPFGSEVS